MMVRFQKRYSVRVMVNTHLGLTKWHVEVHGGVEVYL